MSTYKWDPKKWEKDEEWWNPYNPKGRLKGKGTTSWARQLRRQAQQPLQKEAENQKELAEGQPAELPKPLEKKAKRNKSAAQTAIGKMAEEARQAFGKKAEASETKEEKEHENKKGGKEDAKAEKT